MTNSVDLDQTALLKEQSEMGLHILSGLTVLKLRFCGIQQFKQ